MAPHPLNEDVLNSVDESRRDFLRKVIVGTAFAAPLMASFSMDGLLINAAEASCASNMFTSNMFCSNMPYTGPSEFEADLTGTTTTAEGEATFKLTMDGEALAYKLKVDSSVTVQDACIFVPSFGPVVTLTEGNGVINGDSVATGFCVGSPSERFNALLEAIAGGQAEVRVQTNEGEIAGPIEPED